jgi:hypothetical protein
MDETFNEDEKMTKAKKKKYVTRRRTPKQVAAQEAKDKEFRFGFALGLILLSQTYGSDGQLDEIILYTLNDAGYDVSNFEDINFDPKDRDSLNKIFGVT